MLQRLGNALVLIGLIVLVVFLITFSGGVADLRVLLAGAGMAVAGLVLRRRGQPSRAESSRFVTMRRVLGAERKADEMGGTGRLTRVVGPDVAAGFSLRRGTRWRSARGGPLGGSRGAIGLRREAYRGEVVGELSRPASLASSDSSPDTRYRQPSSCRALRDARAIRHRCQPSFSTVSCPITFILFFGARSLSADLWRAMVDLQAASPASGSPRTRRVPGGRRISTIRSFGDDDELMAELAIHRRQPCAPRPRLQIGVSIRSLGLMCMTWAPYSRRSDPA